jgi:hypothetical protein
MHLLFKRQTATLLVATLILVLQSATAQRFSSLIDREVEKWDWLTLNTGEILKGKATAMYLEELEFDSDHFGVITIDWDDVAELTTNNSQSIQTVGKEIIVGNIILKGDSLQVGEGSARRQLNKDEVSSMTTSAKKEIDRWLLKASVGANVRSGNVEQTDMSVRATVQRRTPKTRFSWDYTGNFSKTDEIETANNHRTNAYFDYYLTDRNFLRPVNLEYFRDPYQNISHRLTASVAVGYTLVKRNDLNINITGGPSWQQVKFKNVAQSSPETESSGGGIVTSNVDWEINNWIDFIGSYRAQWAPDESGGISTHSDSTIAFELTDNMDFSLSFIWDWLQYPVQDENGESPDQNDYRIILSLGMDL